MSEKEKTFGPSAIMTPANGLTFARLLAGPIFAIVIAELHRASWVLLVLWIVLSLSDGLDGWLARSQGTTRSGAFLDPLADKFLVLGAFAALAYDHSVSWIAVAIIAVREIAMSVFRARVGRRGISVPARFSAKVKTVLQDTTIGFAVSPLMANYHHNVITIMMWAAVVLTVTTGYSYLHDVRAGAIAVPSAQTMPDHSTHHGVEPTR